MTQAVADKKVNLNHVQQANDLLQRTLKGAVSEDQMKAVALVIGSGQNPTEIALARMIKVAFAGDLERRNLFLAEQAKLYTAADHFVQHLIDGDADPFVPRKWQVIEHRKCGQVEWNKEMFADPKFLHLEPGQENGSVLLGFELREMLADRSVMNMNILRWLLAHPEHIPLSWKDKAVMFWGTVYKDEYGYDNICYLVWHVRQWIWRAMPVRSNLDSSCPALLTSLMT